MTLEELTDFFRAIAPGAGVLAARVKFDFGESGCVVLDASAEPVTVSNDNVPADTTVHADLGRFARILSGELKGDLEFAMGYLKVEGDLITGVKITQLLSRD
ncbi:MAG: SCP2 sterol-binding domain-containing protein [Pseudomonadota bacterium]